MLCPYILSELVTYFKPFEFLKLTVSTNNPISGIGAKGYGFSSRMLRNYANVGGDYWLKGSASCSVARGQVRPSHVRNNVKLN